MVINKLQMLREGTWRLIRGGESGLDPRWALLDATGRRVATFDGDEPPTKFFDRNIYWEEEDD